jgi:hypothetical protein
MARRIRFRAILRIPRTADARIPGSGDSQLAPTCATDGQVPVSRPL